MNSFIFQQYTSCKISILPLLTHLHVSHLGKSLFSSPQLGGAEHELWNKPQRKFRDFWVKVHSHKTVGNRGGNVVGRGQLGGPGNCRLPLSPIINSSRGRLYTFFLRCHTPFPPPTLHLKFWFTLVSSFSSTLWEHIQGFSGKARWGRNTREILESCWLVTDHEPNSRLMALPGKAYVVLLKQQQMTQNINVKYVDKQLNNKNYHSWFCLAIQCRDSKKITLHSEFG